METNFVGDVKTECEGSSDTTKIGTISIEDFEGTYKDCEFQVRVSYDDDIGSFYIGNLRGRVEPEQEILIKSNGFDIYFSPDEISREELEYNVTVNSVATNESSTIQSHIHLT